MTITTRTGSTIIATRLTPDTYDVHVKNRAGETVASLQMDTAELFAMEVAE